MVASLRVDGRAAVAGVAALSIFGSAAAGGGAGAWGRFSGGAEALLGRMDGGRALETVCVYAVAFFEFVLQGVEGVCFGVRMRGFLRLDSLIRDCSKC